MTNLYDTRTLAKVVNQLTPAHAFLLKRFFPEILTYATKKIDFDVISKGRKLAPFVSPMAAGKPMKNRGQQTQSFEPAYIKAKHPVDPSAPLRRRPGESYGAGDMDPSQRRDAAIADNLSDEEEAILRRLEWMAAQILAYGAVTVSGEDYPEQLVDFGRDASLSVTLVGDFRWGQVSATPMKNIETWAGLVNSASGAAVRDVVFTAGAWNKAREDQSLLTALDTRRAADSSMELGPVQIAPESGSARKLGTIGELDFWLYNDVYEDDAGNSASMLADGTVLLGGPAIEGVQAYGAIQDAHATAMGLVETDRFYKNWITDDPSIEFTMTQCAPLLVPSRVNATFRASVL